MIASRLLDHELGGKILFSVIAVVLVVVPTCNLVVSPESIFYISTFTVTLLGKYLCYALLALGLDLVWGYVGIMSLGHGAFLRWADTRWGCI